MCYLDSNVVDKRTEWSYLSYDELYNVITSFRDFYWNVAIWNSADNLSYGKKSNCFFHEKIHGWCHDFYRVQRRHRTLTSITFFDEKEWGQSLVKLRVSRSWKVKGKKRKLTVIPSSTPIKVTVRYFLPITNWLFDWLIDWFLTAFQPVLGYFMPKSWRIAFTIYVYCVVVS